MGAVCRRTKLIGESCWQWRLNECGSIRHHSFQKRCVSIASNPNICYHFIKWMGDIMSMKQWCLFTSTRGVYPLIIQTYVSVLKNGWVTLGPLSKTAWTVEPSWTAWTSEPQVPHEERSAGRTAPLTGRTILQPKAIRCSWYRVRALVRKCVRRSVCQRAVSARRALTGLSANHVRVKQYHVCPSANFCCVSAGKGSLPWSASYKASRYIYFTPSQCPLAFKCFCFFSQNPFQ